VVVLVDVLVAPMLVVLVQALEVNLQVQQPLFQELVILLLSAAVVQVLVVLLKVIMEPIPLLHLLKLLWVAAAAALMVQMVTAAAVAVAVLVLAAVQALKDLMAVVLLNSGLAVAVVV
jgi:hypothetical protein